MPRKSRKILTLPIPYQPPEGGIYDTREQTKEAGTARITKTPMQKSSVISRVGHRQAQPLRISQNRSSRMRQLKQQGEDLRYKIWTTKSMQRSSNATIRTEGSTSNISPARSSDTRGFITRLYKKGPRRGLIPSRGSRKPETNRTVAADLKIGLPSRTECRCLVIWILQGKCPLIFPALMSGDTFRSAK